VPDVVGYTLGEAVKLLQEQGITISAVGITAPPKSRTVEYDDSYRVIRQRFIDENKIEILICKPL